MAQTLFIETADIYSDYLGAGTLNALLDFFMNSRTTQELQRLLVDGEDMTQIVQLETTNQLMRIIYTDYLDTVDKNFANGWRVYCELTDAGVPRNTPIPNTWPYWETELDSGIARTYETYFLNTPSIDPVGETMYLVQITDYSGNLIPIYKYNPDGTENGEAAKIEWQDYILILDALGINNCFVYRAGQNILASSKYTPAP